MNGTFTNPAMLVTTLMIAMVGAYVGLGVAERTRSRSGTRFYAWLAIASLSVGLGMSPMLFCMPIVLTLQMTPIQFAVIGLSTVLALLALFSALVLVSRGDAKLRSLVPAGILSALALVLIQYGRFAAMAHRVPIRYDTWFTLYASVCALVCLTLALWMWRVSWNRQGWTELAWNSGSKMVMGLTICLTHILSQFGVRLDPSKAYAHVASPMDDSALAYILGAATLVLFGLIHFSTYMERRDAMAKLVESEQRYKSLVEQNTYGVYMLDLEGRFTSVNPAAEKLTGYREPELLNRPFWEFVFDEDVEPSVARFQRSLDRGDVTPTQVDIRHKDGHRVSIEIQKVLMVVNDQLVGMYGIARDISEQKRTEDILRTSERLSVVGKLAAGLAHEIRNPLTGLKGFTQLLRSRTDEYKDYCDIMLSELDRIETIVSELLVLAKPQAAQFQRRDIRVILSRCIALLESQAILSNVRVTTVMDEQLPPVWCEENHLKQLFINLIKNGIEAMPNGGTIHVHAFLRDKHVLVQVKDEGCGIPADHIDKLGEPFFTTKEKGTGLGLMVCSQIIRNHNGGLNIQSRVNEGTTIEVELPLSIPEHEETAS